MTQMRMDTEDLLGLVMDANADYRRGKAAVIEAAIRGGHHLLTAKEQLPHRDFLPFLERAGLEPRTAQGWSRALPSGGCRWRGPGGNATRWRIWAGS